MRGLVERVSRTIRERGLLSRSERIVVAVSGGVDSMVLLHVLSEIGPSEGWRMTVAHFNHQLRGESSDLDEAFVSESVAELGLEFVAGRGAVQERASREKISVEMAGRQMRHQFLAAAAAEAGAEKVVLAHHLNDQVELFFLRLLRGSGSMGLGGMRWTNGSPVDAKIRLVRPLLDVPRTELEEFASEREIRFREDASNAQVEYDRNLIRQELLPLLRGKYQANLDRVVSRMMEVLRAESEFVREEAIAWGMRRTDFEDWPAALQRRWLVEQLIEMGQELDFELVEVLRESAERSVTASGGQILRRTREGKIEVGEGKALEFELEDVRVALAGSGGRTRFGGVMFEWERCKGPGRLARRSGVEWFDAERIGEDIVLRHWRPGDRMKLIGMAEAVKLQDLFTNLKVPKKERRRRVVAAAADGQIFWVEGMRISEDFKVAGGREAIRWKWRRET